MSIESIIAASRALLPDFDDYEPEAAASSRMLLGLLDRATFVSVPLGGVLIDEKRRLIDHENFALPFPIVAFHTIHDDPNAGKEMLTIAWHSPVSARSIVHETYEPGINVTALGANGVPLIGGYFMPLSPQPIPDDAPDGAGGVVSMTLSIIRPEMKNAIETDHGFEKTVGLIGASLVRPMAAAHNVSAALIRGLASLKPAADIYRARDHYRLLLHSMNN